MLRLPYGSDWALIRFQSYSAFQAVAGRGALSVSPCGTHW